jgi:hypothetical protein
MSAPVSGRLELVVLDLINHGLSRTGLGFGNYPLGIRDAVERLLPLVNRDDSAAPAIDRAWDLFKEKLS